MTVYILHFNKRIGSRKHSSQHYVGYTSRKVAKRLDDHLAGHTTPIIDAFREAGAVFEIGNIFPNGDRTFERRLKRNGGKLAHCRICQEEKIIKQQIGVENMESEITTTFYVCGISHDRGETLVGNPIVLTSSDLETSKAWCAKHTETSGALIETIVLHKFTAKIQGDQKQCGGWFGEPCQYKATAQYPEDNPIWCGDCRDLAEDALDEQELDDDDSAMLEAEESYYEREAANKGQIFHADDDDIPF